MRHVLSFRRVPRRVAVATMIGLAASLALAPQMASAEGLFDFLFGGFNKPQPQRPAPQGSFFADPFGTNPQNQPQPRMASSGSGAAFCVRSCDGRYFPLTRGLASPAQMCQAFCPASPTKIYYGSNIDYATSANGERYADSETAFAYRQALRADCTCNGRDPAGLAPVDLSLDTSLRPGDVVATSDGLVAYSGPRGSGGQAADFKPVASYPGLNSDMRAKLSEMKVAPVRAEMLAADALAAMPPAETSAGNVNAGNVSVAPPLTIAPKPARAKRADVD
ncbi:conserved exported protein of unknown function [Bradyrhizobium sp. ORS 285]|uniref:DUF2865 domain-containing protein n=1 Tax=Bradyrhizobium sp. ORS 285 TaxID=115808 RepID=UPI0002406D38|nr:DUF2865 domain-containing protein [Bradyrhizobium sp. ORS 285]CCD86115.1 conserved exported hypothetical protein [Bradyrhizobium sp. ORS 285]SMX55569.1 conserved exported protein of unknown function [Bradyrhizobium sp. ORS 285]